MAFELQADCYAGTWANSAYKENRLEDGDVQEALDAALAVGDFDTDNPGHHGTPEQREEAWNTGFEAGDPSSCSTYLDAFQDYPGVTLRRWPNGSTRCSPGVLHWTAPHPSAGVESGSHLLAAEGVLIDPIAPLEGIEWLDDRGVAVILLDEPPPHALGVRHPGPAGRADPRAAHRDARPAGGPRHPYDFGEELPGGIVPHAISATWPDETALAIPRHRAVAIADGVTGYEGLGFFPDHLLGDDPGAEKQRLRDGFARAGRRSSASTTRCSRTARRSSATAARRCGASRPPRSSRTARSGRRARPPARGRGGRASAARG